MTRSQRFALFTFLFTALVVPLRGGDLILGINGQTRHQIILPDSIPDVRLETSVKAAANLMRTAFAAQGIDLPIAKESEKDPERHGIYLGATTFAKAHGVDVSSLQGATFVHKAVGKDLIVTGRDSDEPLSRRGLKIEQGTLFSVGEFLYRYAGARYLQPERGEAGTEFLQKRILYVPDDLNTRQEPWLREHMLWASVQSDIYFYQLQHADSWRRIGGSSHHVINVITYEKYAETHPEYFALHNGLRMPEQGRNHYIQVCFSNPDVRELLYQDFLRMFDEGYDIVADGQPDGYSPCQCEKCRTLYGVEPTTTPLDGINYLNDRAWGEKLWIMHRDMAERLLKDRPGKKLMVIAYGPATRPPTTFDSFPTNTIIHMANSSEASFEAWSKIKVPAGYAVYYYPFNGTRAFGRTPLTTAQSFKVDMERFVKNNVRILNVDTQPMVGGILNLDGPAIYTYYRLGIDPNLKTAYELFNEYIEAAYLEAAAPMRKFFETLEFRVDARRKFASYMDSAPVGCDSFFILGAFWPVDFILELERSLTTAEKMATTPRVQGRLASLRQDFDHLKHIAFVIQDYRSYLKDGDAASLGRLLAALDARNAQIDAVAGKNDDNRKRLQLSGGALDRAPFNWDVEKIRSEGIADLKDKELDVTRATSKPTLDSPLWKAVPETPFAESQRFSKGSLRTQTSFQLLYDDQALYLRTRGTLPADMMKFVNRGRDANLWEQECIVVNLSPEGDKSRYYYFTYEPVEGSFNDAQHGFIRDSTHPRFGWNDESWNGDWPYTFRMLPETGEWITQAEFPFKTLGAEVPKSGTEWIANFGRVHRYTDENGKATSEHQVWNGILNMSQIPGDASMGRIHFR